MTTGVIDWAVRMAMLVLAGLVTLALLGSLAALSNQPAPLVSPTRPPPAGPRDEVSAPTGAAAADRPSPPLQDEAGPSTGTAGTAAMPAPAPPARWLEAIAYALLALAGLFAVAILLLWRSLRQIRRIADALEATARR